MKDYYKILGLKANVSPEDIHARWIKLMRKFHPDRGRNRGAEDKRVREINEAYEVLKHPSARAHYDLERNYRRKKRNLYLQRIILAPAILIVLLVLALIYLRRPWGTPQPESTFSPALASITNALNDPNVLKDPNAPNAPNQTSQINETDQIDQTNQTDEIDQINESKTSPLVIKAKPSRKNRKAVTSSDKSNVPDQKNQTNQPRVAKAKNPPKIPKPVTASNKPNAPNVLNLTNDLNDLSHLNQLSQLTAPSLVATEEEVKQFLDKYREGYARKDIEGFLSLFSSRAVQNQTDGFHEIKEIYSRFFDRSETLRYHVEDTRIQIYQNAVEIWGRYEIDQTVKVGRQKKVWRGEIRWILLRENGDLKIRFLDFKPQESP